jgi:protein kinase C substrate 80K-H
LYSALQAQSKALKSVHHYYLQYQERAAALGEILASLKEGYNPNYQDMAVLEAVRGWDAMNAPEEEGNEEEQKEVKFEDQLWTEDQIKYQLDGLLNKDYPGLLIEHDTHLANAEEDSQSSRALISCNESLNASW